MAISLYTVNSQFGKGVTFMMKKVCLRLLVAIVLMAALVPAVSAAAEGRGINAPNPFSWEGN
jgi:hypothetical protein